MDLDLDLYLFKIFDFMKTFYMNSRQIYFDIVWWACKSRFISCCNSCYWIGIGFGLDLDLFVLIFWIWI